jgi:hypothetical protein
MWTLRSKTCEVVFGGAVLAASRAGMTSSYCHKGEQHGQVYLIRASIPLCGKVWRR